MAPDGRELMAVSDQGYLVTAEIERDDTDRLLRFGPFRQRDLGIPPRESWPDTWFYSDAEGLAQLADGRIAVSYEGLHRVMLHSRDGAFSEWIPIPELFSTFGINTGLEAVAVREDGTILAVSENWEPTNETHRPLFAFADGAWRIETAFPAEARFRPVGLDLDERGRLYLLERRVTMFFRFASRVRRITFGEGGEVAAIETLLETQPGRHGNLEGISLWRRADGMLIATLITDNNLLRYQRHDLVEYALPD